MLKKANINWTVKALCNHIKKGEINFDCSVQRGYAWDNDKKSLLIHSLIEGYPVPPFYLSKNDSIYDSLDGKQRSTAIYDFVNNNFALTENIPEVEDEDGNMIDVSGMFFENLPEWAQDRIKDYSLFIYYFEDMTEEQVHELFFRLNNGKPLSSIELTRVKANSLVKFQEIAKHEAIANSVTDKGKEKYNDELLSMQIYSIIFDSDPDFTTKVFRPRMVEAEVTDEQKDKIMQTLDYVKSLHDSFDEKDKDQKKILKRVRSRTHLVSVAYFAALCIENNIEIQTYINKATAFFDSKSQKASIDDSYNSSIGAASARADNVAKRKAAMQNLVNN